MPADDPPATEPLAPAEKPVITSPEERFSQYLFLGRENPDFISGNWFVHNYFHQHRVPSLEELVSDKETALVPITLIENAFESNLAPHPEAIIFALALCSRQKTSEALRKAAYDMVNKICAKPEDFILFVKFTSQLSKERQEPTNGWGSGLRKVVNNWYQSKEPLELLKCVTRYKGRYGWKHRDIIKLSHPHGKTIGHEAVFKYILKGLRELKESYQNNPEVEPLIKYAEKIETFKQCQDDVQGARLLEIHELTLDHVPGHFLKSEEVWNALIPLMDLPTLLNNLQRIHNLGILNQDSGAVAKVMDVLTSQEILTRDKVHPASVLITIRDYENSGKPLSYEKRKIKEGAKKPIATPPKPNKKIIEALYKTLNISFQFLKPTNLRFMVTINMSKPMQQTRTWHSGNVNVAEAGCMIALSLLRCEKNVTIATFKDVGVHTINLDPTSSFGQAMRRLQNMPTGLVDLGKAMSWAAHKGKKYDVFINVVDQMFLTTTDASMEALSAYRQKMNLPNTKLINCSLSSSSLFARASQDKNLLIIYGFDATVPKVIQAFSKSLF